LLENLKKFGAESFSIRSLFSLISLVCLILTAYFTATLGSMMYNWFLGDDGLYQSNQTVADKVAKGSGNKLEIAEYKVITSRDIFGKYPKKAEAPPVEEKKTELKLRLVGTNLGDNIFAIIEDTKTKEQDVFDLNDKIFETGAKLAQVFGEKVELERSGEYQKELPVATQKVITKAASHLILKPPNSASLKRS